MDMVLPACIVVISITSINTEVMVCDISSSVRIAADSDFIVQEILIIQYSGIVIVVIYDY